MDKRSIRRRQPPARRGRTIITAAAIAALALMQGVAPAAGNNHGTDHGKAQPTGSLQRNLAMLDQAIPLVSLEERVAELSAGSSADYEEIGLPNHSLVENDVTLDPVVGPSHGESDTLEAYLDTLNQTTDPVFALMNAVESIDKERRTYNDAVDEFGVGSDEVSKAAVGLASATVDLEQASINGDLSYGAFAVKLGQWVDHGVLTAAQAAAIRERVAEVRRVAEDHEGGYEATMSEDVAQPSINRSISAIDYAARARPVPLNLSVRGNASDQRFNHIDRGNRGPARTTGR
jgi:hypothetical protein